MTDIKLIQKLINCNGFVISDYDFCDTDETIRLWIKPYKNGRLCPECGRRGTIVKNSLRKERVWRDLPLGDWKVDLHYCPHEITCPTHGRKQESIPWAAPFSRVSHRFEYQMLCMAKEMTLSAVAGILKMPLSTLSDILHRCVQRERKDHEIGTLTSLGIDEISYTKGKKFATIVYDLERSKVVWIGKGKGRETIDHFFENVLGKEKSSKVKAASCDMAQAYIGAIEHYCKNAELVLDRFHVVKAINDAVDEVRKEAWRELCKDDRKAIKGLRWLLYRHSTTRKKSDTKTLNDLKKGNNRIYRAWVLKDEFEKIWTYSYRKRAEDFLKAWITRTLRSRIEPMKKFARTVRKHFHRITAFTTTKLTNAVAEGLNRMIKILKNRASGFHKISVYSDMIYLKVGDLDIPAQIPDDFKTRCFGGNSL